MLTEEVTDQIDVVFVISLRIAPDRAPLQGSRGVCADEQVSSAGVASCKPQSQQAKISARRRSGDRFSLRKTWLTSSLSKHKPTAAATRWTAILSKNKRKHEHAKMSSKARQSTALRSAKLELQGIAGHCTALRCCEVKRCGGVLGGAELMSQAQISADETTSSTKEMVGYRASQGTARRCVAASYSAAVGCWAVRS